MKKLNRFDKLLFFIYYWGEGVIKMDIIEAIAWVRLLTACLNSPASCNIKEQKESLENCGKTDEIVNMLRQGEKYKAIVEDIEKDFRKEVGFMEAVIITEKSFNIIKQRYLPKSIDEKSFKELSQTINRFNKTMSEMALTCKEVVERLIPED